MNRSKPTLEAQSARFITLRQKLLQNQGDLLSQYQREARELPTGDGVAAMRLKLIYRQKGLKI